MYISSLVELPECSSSVWAEFRFKTRFLTESWSVSTVTSVWTPTLFFSVIKEYVNDDDKDEPNDSSEDAH